MALAPQLAFQYAAKFICGKVSDSGGIMMPGTYTTVVNVHNPTNQDLDFRFKFAGAKDLGDGPITGFRVRRMGPDGAQYFDCKFIRDFASIAQTEVDGFLVIECARSLDVVAVYTTNSFDQNGVPAIAVERVFERKTG